MNFHNYFLILFLETTQLIRLISELWLICYCFPCTKRGGGRKITCSVHGATTKCDLSNRACMLAGIICISSVYLITTDAEYQAVCCQILGSINITLAHWGGIQPISGPKPCALLYGIHFNKLDNPRLVQVIGSALQQMCCQTTINLKLLSQYSLFFWAA